MDISTVIPSEIVVDIKHPGNDKPIGVKVSLVSLDDDRLKKVRDKIDTEARKLAKRGKLFSTEETRVNLHTLLFNAMTGWSWENDATFHGEKPQFNIENVKRLFTELPWFQAQIETAIDDGARFFQN